MYYVHYIVVTSKNLNLKKNLSSNVWKLLKFDNLFIISFIALQKLS